jgi:hypothetical protein
MNKTDAVWILLTALVLSATSSCPGAESSTPSEMAIDNYSAANGLCWLVDLNKGWPVLGRMKRHLPLDAYRGAKDTIFTVALADSASPKPQVRKDSRDCLDAVYQLDAGRATLTINRLCPAILLDSPGKSVAFVSAAGPDYIAFSRNGKPVVYATSKLADLPAEAFSFDEPWILVWFGDSSPARAHIHRHDVEDERGVSKGPDGFNKEPNVVDIPVLLRLEHRVRSIQWNSQRGLVLNFAAEVGKLTAMPLAGGRLFLPEQTKQWAAGLPAEITEACRRWSARLSDFPVSVVESFVADPAGGTVTIKQRFKWNSFEDDWHSKSVKAAPIPPMLGLALTGGAPVHFFSAGRSVRPIDYNFMDTAGLAMAVEGVDKYEYKITNVNDLLRVPTHKPAVDGQTDAKLLQEKLEKHVGQMVDAGHIAPLFYIYGGIGGTWFSHFYWGTSSELAQALAMAYPYLSGPLKTEVVEYLKSEWKLKPPFEFDPRHYLSGTPRTPYELPWKEMSRHVTYALGREADYRRSDYLFSLYGVDAYLRLTGEPPDSNLRATALDLATQMLRKQDWAIMGPSRFRTIKDRHAVFYYNLQGAATYNRWLAGMIGFTRLAHRYGWADEEKLGYYLVAKLAMARVAQAHYVTQMYQRGLVRGRADSDNRTVLHIDTGCAVVGRGPMEVGVHQNQETPPFNDLVEEVGCLLGRYARSQCRIYLDQLDYSLPFWYISEAPKEQATEQRTTPLQYYSGNVLAQYWILGKRRSDFSHYLDTTRFLGDLYYIENLAAGIDSYTASAAK